MCGRLLSERYEARAMRDADLARERERLTRFVGDKSDYESLFRGRYNIAPTQDCPVIRRDGDQADLYSMQWRFVPSWAKDPKPKFNTINAIGEEIANKPAFRTAWKRGRRCLVPVTGWYEWRGPKGARQPCLVRSESDRLIYLGGIWDRWERDDELLESFAIITVAANPALADLHARMPLVVDAANDADWLHADAASAEQLIAPHPGSDWTFYPVSPALNNARNDDEALAQPLGAAGSGGQ